MIRVICTEEQIRYNAYNIVKAFWPEEEVRTELAPAEDQAWQQGSRIEVLQAKEGTLLVRADSIRALYDGLRAVTGRSLPWGMLTGVRPVKLAMQWLREHGGVWSAEEEGEQFRRWFYEERAVSPEKAALAYEVACAELDILHSAGPLPGSASLYIGIPFCPSICRYCSFSSGSIERFAGAVEPYLDTLIAELRKKKEQYFSEHSFPLTIYIGGGTPTSLSAEQLARLLRAAEEIYGIRRGLSSGRIREYTVEAGRPDSIIREKLQVLKEYGVTRISVNPQTMNQKTLDAIGRCHTVEQTEDAFALARSMGFDNINMDLIMGLPGENAEDVSRTLGKILAMRPDSLTIHSLAVKRASAIGMARKQQPQGQNIGRSHKPDETGHRIEEMIRAGYENAIQMGMHPYYLYRQKQIAGNFENIGYALPGKEGLYNILIMEEVQSIIACGAGASTKIVTQEEVPNPRRGGRMTRIVRMENVKNIEEYIRRGV